MISLWIDTDIGDDIDDVVALLVAVRHPELRLVGVSTVFGLVERRRWLARELLRRAGWEGPVLSGAVRPLQGRTPNAEPSSYLTVAPDDLPVARPEEDEARVAAIAEAMLARPEPFHFVTIGAMTNAAKLLQQHPEVRERWQSVVGMAGELEGRAEWNVSCDVAGAKVVLRELHPRWVGLEACSNTLPRGEVEALLDAADPASAFLLECYRGYRGDREEAPLTLFDPIAALSLVQPEAFNLQQVRVLVEGEGRLRLTDDGYDVEYALSSEWEAVRPTMRRLLGGVG